MTALERCNNWPCAKPAGHDGPCNSVYDPPPSSKDESLLGNDILTCLCKHEGEHPLLRQAAVEIRELRERLFFATIPAAPPELITEARRQGKLPPDETPVTQCVFRTGCVNGQRCVDAGHCTHGAEMLESMQRAEKAQAKPVCEKHGVELAFEGDHCWACLEENVGG